MAEALAVGLRLQFSSPALVLEGGVGFVAVGFHTMLNA
jgi:hypothetical protein